MIHATILEHITDDDEREAMNLAILGRAPDPASAGPLRYARPEDLAGVAEALRRKTVPVGDAIAALSSQIPKGALR